MNTFGTIFRISIFGESHGAEVGVVIDGCPAGIEICKEDFEADLKRRKSGAKGTTPRIEADEPEIVSGIFNGHTTGTPITIVFKNANTHSSDYSNLVAHPRPGHADFTGRCKYDGFNDYRGGGHFSARITVGIVAAGVIAKKILKNVDIKSSIIEVGGLTDIDAAVANAMSRNDSVGGIVDCRVKGLPVGLGEPFWNSVESVVSHAVFAIPGVKAIEFGCGFASAKMFGSEHNDAIIDANGTTATNNAGGVNGGITNGNEFYFRIAVKPTSSIAREQQTFNFETSQVEPLIVKGRHDACIALRVPPILEAMTAIALADLYLCAK